MLVLVHDLHARVLAEQGEQLRQSLLDPTRDYQRQAKPWMFRDISGTMSQTSHGAPGRIRTCDPLLRRQPLYSAELQGLED